jgi:hypothetical protein
MVVSRLLTTEFRLGRSTPACKGFQNPGGSSTELPGVSCDAGVVRLHLSADLGSGPDINQNAWTSELEAQAFAAVEAGARTPLSIS